MHCCICTRAPSRLRTDRNRSGQPMEVFHDEIYSRGACIHGFCHRGLGEVPARYELSVHAGLQRKGHLRLSLISDQQ